jgi:hypothetical protein
MQVSIIRRTLFALGAVAVLALSTSGLPLAPTGPATAQAAVEAHHHVYWQHVPVTYRFYNGPLYTYSPSWYLHRHISFPSLYRVYDYEPVSVCVTEYYYYGGAYYCYAG